jgi:hypothetical protein
MGQRLGNNCISDTHRHHPQPADPIDMRVPAIFIQVLDAGISTNDIDPLGKEKAVSIMQRSGYS